MAYGESDTRTRRADGPAITPVVWHLERQGGRNFTIGVYSGVGERWDAKSGKWAQTAKGYFAEISERIILQQGTIGGTLKRYDRTRARIGRPGCLQCKGVILTRDVAAPSHAIRGYLA